MEVNLNFNSLDAKLYRWFYITDNMPKSLCSYFWKLLFMWILIIPYTIFSLPTIILSFFKKIYLGIIIDKWYDRLFFTLMLNFVIFMVTAIGYTILNLQNYELLKENEFFQIGFIGTLIASILIIVLIINFIYFKIKSIRYSKSNSDSNSNIIVNMVVSTYKKYCPKINWFK